MVHVRAQGAVTAGRVSMEEVQPISPLRASRHALTIYPWLLRQLSPEEREALGRLSLFRGGFEQEAAAAMLRGSYTPAVPQETLRRLTATACLQLAASAPLSSPAASAGPVRYSMHALVAEVFRGGFGELPEDVQGSILRDFAQVVAARLAMIEALKHAGSWQEATVLLADGAPSFQALRAALHGSVPVRPAASLRQLAFLGHAMLAGLRQPAEAPTQPTGMTELACAVLGPHYADTLVSDISIAGPGSQLPARLYKPHPKAGQRLSALVYFHGMGRAFLFKAHACNAHAWRRDGCACLSQEAAL